MQTTSLKLLLAIFILQSYSATLRADPPVWKDQFWTLLSSLPQYKVDPHLDQNPGERYAARLRVKNSGGDDICASVCSLALSGEIDYVRLSWYRERNRHRRVFIAAVAMMLLEDGFWEKDNDDVSFEFDLACDVFGHDQAKFREEELHFVTDNAPRIAGFLVNYLGKSLDKKKTIYLRGLSLIHPQTWKYHVEHMTTK